MAVRHELNFLEFIQSFRRGELLDEGNQRLEELMEALANTGGNGSLTVTFNFKTNKAGQRECTPKVSIKKPDRALGAGIYFISDDNRLTRRDPKQMDIEDEIDRRRSMDA